MTSNRHVTVWIDHNEARLFHVDAESVEETTVRAPMRHIHRHPKGGTAEHHHPDDAQSFYRSVARELEGVERVLVVGPSTAKLHFVRYVHKNEQGLEPRIVGLETVDHPTDKQLVAYSKRYFAADDQMQGTPRVESHH